MARSSSNRYEEMGPSPSALWIVVVVIFLAAGSFLFGRFVLGERMKKAASPVRNVAKQPIIRTRSGEGSSLRPQERQTSPRGSVSILSTDEMEEEKKESPPAADERAQEPEAGQSQAKGAGERGPEEARREKAEQRPSDAEERLQEERQREQERRAREERLQEEERQRQREQEQREREERLREEERQRQRERERREREERLKEEAAQRLEQEKKAREAERVAAEKQRREAERVAAEKQRREAERLAAEKQRREAERLAAEARRKQAAEEARREAERKAAEARKQREPAPISPSGSRPAEGGGPTIPPPSGLRYRVRAGVFSDQARAQAQADKVKAAGHDVYVRPITRGGRTVYEVQIGLFSDRERAERKRAELAQDGIESTMSVE